MYWEYRQARTQLPTLAEWGGGARAPESGAAPRLLVALAALHAQYGALSWGRVLQPAIDFARLMSFHKLFRRSTYLRPQSVKVYFAMNYYRPQKRIPCVGGAGTDAGRRRARHRGAGAGARPAPARRATASRRLPRVPPAQHQRS